MKYFKNCGHPSGKTTTSTEIPIFFSPRRCRLPVPRPPPLSARRSWPTAAMPRHKAKPRRNECAGVEANATPGSARDETHQSKSKKGRVRHPLESFVVPVKISGLLPTDRRIARLFSTRMAVADSDTVIDANSTHVRLRAGTTNTRGVEWVMCNQSDGETKTLGPWWGFTLPSSSSEKHEILITAFFVLCREGVFELLPTVFDNGNGPAQSRLDVCLTDEAFAFAPVHPEEIPKKKRHAKMRVSLKWLCPPTDSIARFAAGIPLDTEDEGMGTDAIESAINSSLTLEHQSTLQAVFAAAKPPRDAPGIVGDFPGLVPTPTPYQRRAVHWMVRREKGGKDAQCKAPGAPGAPLSTNPGSNTQEHPGHPLWHPLRCYESNDNKSETHQPVCYVNWHTGQLSVEKFPPPNDVKGGILADEMGLGKTVELLMCILKHKYNGPAPMENTVNKSNSDDELKREPADEKINTEKDEPKNENTDEDEPAEIIGCNCGTKTPQYDGLWLACDSCNEWSHARCVGYTVSVEKKQLKKGIDAEKVLNDARDAEVRANYYYQQALEREAADFNNGHDSDEKKADLHVKHEGTHEMNGNDAYEHSVQSLLEALRVAEKKTEDAINALEKAEEAPHFECGRCVAKRAGATVSGPCGATLVVCPSTILNQWCSELDRHCVPGTLKVVVYEGQPRNASGPNMLKKQKSNAPTSAFDLAAADVVLTTYDTLRNDLHHAPDVDLSNDQRSSRHVKKYEIIPTPLTRLTWWRVVLDEAQEVESSTAAAAAMAKVLPSQHRWCVTGTPVSTSLDDLQGLFTFLHAPSPLTDNIWWRKVVVKSFDLNFEPGKNFHLLDILKKVMWRNSRLDVQGEISLPPQHTVTTVLRSSGIEQHWYRKQQAVCENAAGKALRRVTGVSVGNESIDVDSDLEVGGRRLGGADEDADDDDAFIVEDGDDEDDSSSDEAMTDANGDETNYAYNGNVVDLTKTTDAENDRHLTAQESRKILLPLLRLRQACNHPQAGTHGVRRLGKGQKGVIHIKGGVTGHIGTSGIHAGSIMSMPQIHNVLIEKQKIEAEEAQRLVAFTLNASAGVAYCKGDYATAVGHYRDVLNMEREGDKDDGSSPLRLDALQRLHALHNLRQALDASQEKANGAGPDTTVTATPAPTSTTGIARTLNDSNLEKDANTEREKYLAQRAGGVQGAATKFEEAKSAVTTSLKKCGASNLNGPAGAVWWVEALLDASTAQDGGKQFLVRLIDSGLNGSWQGDSVKFTDLSGFQFVMQRELEKLTEKRTGFLENMTLLTRITKDANAQDVDNAGRCGMCVTGGGERNNFFGNGVVANSHRNANSHVNTRHQVICVHCEVSGEMSSYEDVVFGRQASDEHVRGGARGRVARADVGAGRSAPSSAEMALRYLLTKYNMVSGNKTANKQQAEAHVLSLEEMRREFQRANVLQKHQRDNMHALDELQMAVTRIRVRRDHEIALGGLPDPVPEHLRASVVHDWELDELATQYSNDRVVYKSDLRKASSQVRFLERLKSEDDQIVESSKYLNANDSNSRSTYAFECPVCQEDVDKSVDTSELAILPCGHKLCVSCVDSLVDRAPLPNSKQEPKRFKCPTCREKTPVDEINYVSKGGSRVQMERKPAYGHLVTDMDTAIGTEHEQINFETSIKIKGSWGTKIEAVTRRCLWLLDTNRRGADSDSKILIFSEWEDALRVVAAALRANNVSVAHPGGGGQKLRDAISAFVAKKNANNLGEASMQQQANIDGPSNDAISGGSLLTGSQSTHTQIPQLFSNNPGNTPGNTLECTTDSSPKVLLLPLRRGANGLNLTCASHVVLLEPVMDPGSELQAMKRVDRIGQVKQTFVHRFLLANTVEENVQVLSKRRRDASGAEMKKKGQGNSHGLTVGEAKLLIQGE